MTARERWDPLLEEAISRRSLLKGIGAGAVMLGAGGILSACTNEVKGSGAGSTDTIVIGFVSPQTGALAGFASGDNFVVDRIRATDAYKNGFKVGGTTYSVEIVVKDSQSDPNRASQVARELINQNHADMIVTSSTPETTNPVARQQDPANPQPFKYTTMYFFGAEAFGGCFVPMWNRVDTNKVVGGMFPNDADGNAFRDAWPGIIDAAGYTWVDGGAYPDLQLTDFSQMISMFKQQDCQIYINAPLPPDFNTFWQQAAQQGYAPKLATVAKVLLFPAETEALGDLVNNIATDSWWGPYMPYASSLSGDTAEDLANAYQEDSGTQWLQTLGSTYSLFEIAKEAFTAADDPHDGDAVAAELFKVSYEGISGPLDFTTGPHIDPADPNSPTIPGIGIVNPVGVQWKPGTDWPWEMVVVDNSINADVPIGGDLVPTNP
jgi:branched-chain amino acid transport system substrate-binding protein